MVIGEEPFLSGLTWSILNMTRQEELQVPYALKIYRRDAQGKPPQDELRQMHPIGKVPVLEDGRLKLPESGAIVGRFSRLSVSEGQWAHGCTEYLISRYGKDKFGISDESSQAWVDNLYCECRHRWRVNDVAATDCRLLSDSHFAEGSVQSYVIRWYQYNMIKDQIPYNLLDTVFLAPNLEKYAKQVSNGSNAHFIRAE